MSVTYTLRAWIAQALQRSPTKSVRKHRRRRLIRPGLEELENRVVPSSFLSVNTTSDSHAVTPSNGSGLDSNGKVSLRSALETADAVGSSASTAFTINIPAGTYSLTLGVLQVGSASDPNVVLTGTGLAANTIIQQTGSNSSVFSLNPALSANVQVSISNVEITGGNTHASFGGGGIIDGGAGNSLTLSKVDVSVTGNTAQDGSGGGIEFDGGSLTLNNCTITNNTATGGTGGGVDFQPLGSGTLSTTGSTFSGNNATKVGSSGGQGGALYVNGFTGNSYSVSGSTFVNNQAAVSGGALANANGTVLFNYNRLLGNTSPSGSGILNASAGGASVDASNNWWGSNTDPSTVSGLLAGTVTTNPWLELGTSASPSSLPPSTTSTITVGFTQNSSGTTVSASNLTAVVGLPVSFSATAGSTTMSTGVIQSSGQATTTFTAGTTPGPASVSATVDNTTATANLIISGASADLAVTATGPAAVTAGANNGADNVTYTVTLHNNGPNTTTGVQITDALTAPSGVTISPSTSVSQGSFNSGTAIWAVGTLANGATATLTLVLGVASSTASGAVIQEAASVTSSTATDPNSSNNTSSTVSTTVQTQADLSISNAGPVTATVGDPSGYTYTLTVINNGPSDNTGGFTATDTLPAGTTFQTSGSDPGWSASGQTLTYTTANGLASGASQNVLIHVTVNGSVASGTALADHATVVSNGTADPNSGNNTSNTVNTTAVSGTSADLSISNAGPSTATSGAPAGYIYTLVVTNNGPAANTGGFTVTDTLPTGTTFQAGGSTTGWSASGQALTFTSGNGLANGATLTLVLQVTVGAGVASGTVLQDGATVTSNGTPDGNSSNNTSNTVSTTVQSGHNLTVNTTNDTNAASPTTSSSGMDSSGKISLRSALETADGIGSSPSSVFTINIPAGTYNLSLGALMFGSSTDTDVVLIGTDLASNVVIDQIASSNAPVFNLNPDLNSNVQVSISNIEITGGNTSSFGGGGIIGGGQANSLTLTNVIVTGNTSRNGPGGGGIEFDGGSLTLTNCTISNNTASGGTGGGVDFQPGNTAGSLTVTGSTFSGNQAKTVGSLVGKGGGLYVNGSAGNSYSVTGSTFLNNQATASGGALANANGTIAFNYNRLVGNSSGTGNGISNASASDATVNATNNWWGSSLDPSTVSGLIAGTVTTNPWLVLGASASPAMVAGGSTSVITATFLRNSVGTLLSAGNLTALVGLPVSFAATAGTVTLSTGTIQSTGQAATTFTAGGTPGPGTVTATVDGGTATANLTISAPSTTADLGVTASGPTTVTAGASGGTSNLTYTVTLYNSGPDSASGIQVTDALTEPAGVTISAATTASQGSFNSSTGIWTVGTLANSASATLTLVLSVASSTASGAVIQEAASITASSASDPNSSNNTTNTVSTAVQTQADLSISNAGPANATAGDPSGYTYTLTVTNNGPSNNTGGFTVTDTLPTGTTFQASGSDPGWSASGQALTFTTSSGLASGGTKTILIHVTVGASVANGTVLADNAAVGSNGTTDPNSGNNTSNTVNTTVVGSINADLAITDAGPSAATAGDPAGYTYTVIVTNDGPAANTGGFTVTDTLPAGTTFQASGSDPGWNVSGQSLTFTNTTGLANSGTVTLLIHVTVSSAVAGSTVLHDSATVASNGSPDPNAANNTSSTVSTTVQTLADLQISDAGPSTATAGNPAGYTYTVTVTNNGPSANSGGFTVTDTLPAGTTFQASGSDPGWSASGQTLTFTTSTGLASGGTRNLLLQAMVSATVAAGTVLQDNAAVASNGTTDPNSANNTSNTVSTTVQPLTSHTLTVNTTNDTDAANAASGTGLDSMGNISLRSALETADAVGSSISNPFTINLPTGTYNLSEGNLQFGSAFDANVTITGMGAAANTVIQQTDSVNRVFLINPTLDSNVQVTMSNVEVTGGTGNNSFGGGGILAGGPGNLLTLNNVIVTGNSTSISRGGGIAFVGGGSLVLSDCTISNNSAIGGNGGGVDFEPQTTSGGLAVTGSTFTGNVATKAGANGGQGGALFINGSAGNSYSVSTSTFTNNQTAVSGGAVANAHGTLLFNYNRILGNSSPSGSALVNSSASDASVDASNNWWGSNANPSSVGGLIAGTVTSSPWLELGVSASPTTLDLGGTSAITASFTQNSAGVTVSASNLAALAGLPVSFSATLGTMSLSSGTIQSTGQATTTYTAGAVQGPGTASATVDSGTATVNLTIATSADLAVTASGPATVTAGASGGTNNLTYTVTIHNNGPDSASGVQVTDALTTPSGVTVSGATMASQGSYNGGAAIWTVGTLANGASATLTLVLNVASSASPGATVLEAASVTASSATDPNSSNNTSSTITTTVQGQADLQITNKDNQHPNAVAGSVITFTIVASNAGPSDAAGVAVADTFPSSLGGVTFTAVQTGGASGFSASGSGNINDTATLPTGSSITYTVQATISSGATGTLSTTATVTPPSNVTDPNSANNSATDSDIVTVAPTQLVLVAPPTATAGAAFSLTVTAEDGSGHIASGFTGMVTLSSSSGADIAPTTVSLTEGTATIPVTLTAAGSQTLMATFPGLASGTASISLGAGPFNRYVVTVLAPSTVQAGSTFQGIVQAADQFGNPITNYTGPAMVTASISPTSSGSNFPSTVSISGFGFGFFLGNLQKVGTYAISVANGSFTGSAGPITVTAGPADKLGFATQPVNAPTGVLLPTITVQILDTYGNVVTTDNSDAVTVGVASGPGPFLAGSTVTATAHNGIASFSNLTLVAPGSYTLSAVVPAKYIGPNSTSFTIAPLQVVAGSFAGSPWGFSLQFNAPFLVNSLTPVLYGTGFMATAPVPSVILTTDPANLGDTAAIVTGSLVLNTANNSITFVATNTALEANNGSPLLPDGTYTAIIHGSSATDGFQSIDNGGGFLDGLGNGTPGSGDYTATFVVNAAAANDDAVWVPATADGPGQPLSAPGMNLAGGGYPVYLDDATGAVDIVQVTLNYNPALLTVTGVTGARFTLLGTSTPGQAVLQYSGPALPAGSQTPIGFIAATVPSGAAGNPMPYKAKDLLHLSNVSLNSGAIQVVTSDALHLVAYVGDGNGDGAYSSDDAVEITRVSLQTDSGFTAYPLVDPIIVADTDGDGFIPADAPLQANEAGVGLPAANLPSPAIPSGVFFTPLGNNVDPSLSIQGSGVRGQGSGEIETVSVNIDDAHPAGSSGLIEAHLALTYDPTVFHVSTADIHLGALLADAGSWSLVATINPETGQIGIALSGSTPIASGLGGSLVTIGFHQIAPSPGSASIALVASVDPSGQQGIATELEDAQGTFTLTPAPTNGFDPRIDANVTLKTPVTVDAMPERMSVDDQSAESSGLNLAALPEKMAVEPGESPGISAPTVPLVFAVEQSSLEPSNNEVVVVGTAVHLGAAIGHGAGPLTTIQFVAALLPLEAPSLISGPFGGMPPAALASVWNGIGQRLADQWFQPVARGIANPLEQPVILGNGQEVWDRILPGSWLPFRPAPATLNELNEEGIGDLDWHGVTSSAGAPDAVAESSAVDQYFAEAADAIE